MLTEANLLINVHQVTLVEAVCHAAIFEISLPKKILKKKEVK